MSPQMRRLRIVHVVYSFAIGGLENVIVQLINRLPTDRFEHVVLSLTTISAFKERIQVPGVQFIELKKAPGHAIPLYPRIYRLLRQLRPDVVHSCNLAALEIAPLSWLARVPLRVHAEHGWDAHDPQGANPRYRRLRRFYKPFVSHFVAVSQDIDRYLGEAVKLAPERHSWIANGVDTRVFAPAEGPPALVPGCPFDPQQHWMVGTVGRLQTVKNQPLLARAFVQLLQDHPELAARARLVLVGEGPLRGEVEAVLQQAGLAHLAWLAGARDDVAAIMALLRCFVLPSQAEGTSCTLQEAMACGLPVVATAVGGTPELVHHGRSGLLVPPDEAQEMAQAIWRCYAEPGLGEALGHSAREQALAHFNIDVMVQRYQSIFLQQPHGQGEQV
ncbi:TIGR03088 family PEP-CTERM/XrtA system glycosyltransferase [Hydrogenophaga sp.]|uniref:TIGR03088 family PEP-CTERM/XrtA system glycosyltransferase n=1 Tax=Hydrogenophaga sp. TaxID=1904254 RepID=UPI0035615C46